MTDEEIMTISIPTTDEPEADETPGYNVVVVNMTWSKNSIRPMKKKDSIEFPEALQLEIPENVLRQAQKKTNVFEDIIETYVYNTLTKKYGYELQHCQIWLPLTEAVA